MSNVEFNEQDFGAPTRRQFDQGPRQSWLVSLVMKLGLAKDEKSANMVLLIVAVLFIILAFVVPKLFGPETATTNSNNSNQQIIDL